MFETLSTESLKACSCIHAPPNPKPYTPKAAPDKAVDPYKLLHGMPAADVQVPATSQALGPPKP